jgi:drug/metabolite transporter (DMT)-like permease
MENVNRRSRPAVWQLAVAFALVYFCWGTTYLGIKKGVKDEGLPPALFGGTRLALAGVLLLGYAAATGRPLRLPGRDALGVVVSGLLFCVGGNGLVNVAEKTVPSGVAAVLAATTPLWMALIDCAWPGGERLRAGGWLGLVLGLGGVALLLAPQLSANPGELLTSDVGPLLVLGSAASWALGSLLVRHRRLRMDHLTAAGYQMFLGGVCLALLGLAAGEAGQLPDRVTPGAVGAFVYLLVVGSLLGFVAFNWLMGHVRAAQVGTYAYVNPVIAVFAGWLLGGEELTGWTAAGVTVILAGVALVRSGAVGAGHEKKPRRPEDAVPRAAAGVIQVARE